MLSRRIKRFLCKLTHEWWVEINRSVINCRLPTMWSVSHEHFSQNIVLSFFYTIFPSLSLLHWESNTIPHHKVNSPCCILPWQLFCNTWAYSLFLMGRFSCMHRFVNLSSTIYVKIGNIIVELKLQKKNYRSDALQFDVDCCSKLDTRWHSVYY